MNLLQRTEEWHLKRKGMITASQVAVLMGNHREPLTERELESLRRENPKSRATMKEVPFSQGSYTYLDGKVAEMYMPDGTYLEYVDMFGADSRSTRWGTDWEDEARKAYEKATGYRVEDAPFIPLKGFENFAGGSPDGIVRERCGIVEFKCPSNPVTHMRHYLYESGEDLKEKEPEYYAQCQFNMLVVGRAYGWRVRFCDFVSYDPRTSQSKMTQEEREEYWDRQAAYADDDMDEMEEEESVYERNGFRDAYDFWGTVFSPMVI